MRGMRGQLLRRMAGVGPVYGYAVAVAATGLAVGLRWAISDVLSWTPYLAFYPAVVVAAALGGLGPGLLATALSATCVELMFVPPEAHLAAGAPAESLRVLLFVLGGAGVSVLAEMQRRRHRALVESERKYRTVADNTHAWEFWRGPDGRFIYNSPSCQRITGYEPAEFDADADLVARIVHPDDQAQYAAHRGGSPEACATEEATFRIIRRDGAVRWIAHACVPVYDTDGRFLGIRGSNRDITAQREAEEKLQEQNRFMTNVLESLTHPFYVVDARDYRIVLANSAAGFVRPGDPVTCHQLTRHSPAPCPTAGCDCPIERVKSTGKPIAVEQVHHDAAGKPRTYEVHAYPVRDRDGNVAQVIEYRLDVTEKRQMERELLEAKNAADRANRAKDHFLAVLSHELRTPLTPVVAAVSMLQAAWQCDQRSRDALEMIRRNVEMEARLIDDLLDITRIARGKIELDRKPVLLCEIINRASEVCKPDIEARRLHFGIDCGDCETCRVLVDAARLQQVLWNLLKNAVKFTPPGGCIGIRCRREDDGHVLVEVNDSGIGIGSEDLARIFNAFEQAERSIGRQFGGLGLGLAIARAIVELHGGTITARSEGKDRGASFVVRLPICGVEAAQAPGAPELPDRAPPRRGLRILLVEDHGDTARMMRQLLMMDGHEVTVAGDVATALEESARQSFDLLLSDLGLPDRDGTELMRELRRRGVAIPGIALSGYGQEQDIARSREAGFTAHITKPTSPERLADVIAGVTGTYVI